MITHEYDEIFNENIGTKIMSGVASHPTESRDVIIFTVHVKRSTRSRLR